MEWDSINSGAKLADAVKTKHLSLSANEVCVNMELVIIQRIKKRCDQNDRDIKNFAREHLISIYEGTTWGTCH